MKKIKSYTGIWNVEKVLYAINDFNLPFPVTFTQITWFVITEFLIILFGDIPPLSMIEGAFLKYFGIPVALTWFMSQKTFDGTAVATSAIREQQRRRNRDRPCRSSCISKSRGRGRKDQRGSRENRNRG